ncbi:MAG: type II toxin-antitoxin system RelE/ParE family toxin [Pseudomonadota bacterium]
MADYTLTPGAEADLEGIWDYSADTWSIAQANKYIDQLVVHFEALADKPGLAAPCEHIRAGYRYVHAERHVIYLRTTESGIEIVRILHDRMLPRKHL